MNHTGFGLCHNQPHSGTSYQHSLGEVIHSQQGNNDRTEHPGHSASLLHLPCALPTYLLFDFYFFKVLRFPLRLNFSRMSALQAPEDSCSQSPEQQEQSEPSGLKWKDLGETKLGLSGPKRRSLEGTCDTSIQYIIVPNSMEYQTGLG